MLQNLIYLGLAESGMGWCVADAARGLGLSCSVLSLDAPLLGKPVTVRPGEVLWEGTSLLDAGAILVEAPLFPWPQPVVPTEAPGAEREARSLALSALRAAAEVRPVWNRPETGHLAASPAVSLTRLEAAGVAVRPWRLAPAPGAGQEAGCLVLDAVGRERWHRTSRPPAGEPALVLSAIPGEVLCLLVIGGRIAGACRGAGGDLPPVDGAEVTAIGSVSSSAAGLAIRAAGVLGLDFAAFLLADGDEERVLLADAAPDLATWNALLSGALPAILVQRLAEAALSVA
ncbi:MAG: hypothetical protein LAO51_06495 [Acidobacteriia bacterium]|nr:hypothetical protein [Terriglobia bacterium]